MKFYNEISESYDELYMEEQENKLKLIKNNLKLDGLTLDIGCGTGLSKKFFNVIGIDISFNLLKKGDICAKAEFLPFKDKSFDNIICITSIHHFDLDKSIKEIKRVCKSKIVISIMKKSKNFDKIKDRLHKEFNFKEINEEKDLILFKHSKHI
ncbi:MAG: class I SAM-dependent methyltransferase [Candidatus Nanoarchaeia archaeon]|jgi:ubiquinone/menaquinone biosynthesis C-methylase UbiE|nr:class I SAM-dependent methyltransferase [Candidatus Nanoarchaeia archaeon]|tara:strand:+ start:6538 stop:6996 length:459 start_codon:yes stop_codon:yes gene_type:complete